MLSPDLCPSHRRAAQVATTLHGPARHLLPLRMQIHEQRQQCPANGNSASVQISRLLPQSCMTMSGVTSSDYAAPPCAMLMQPRDCVGGNQARHPHSSLERGERRGAQELSREALPERRDVAHLQVAPGVRTRGHASGTAVTRRRRRRGRVAVLPPPSTCVLPERRAASPGSAR